MTPRRVITVFFKLLVGMVGTCIVTTLFVWLGATEQQPQFPGGSGSALLRCSLAISIFL